MRAWRSSALLTGRLPPASGRLCLLGEDLYAAPREKALALFREVGIVREGGGLVSNLRAWENILLPVSYHAGSRRRTRSCRASRATSSGWVLRETP